MSGSIALDSVRGGLSDGATDGVPITGDAISGGGANRSIDDALSSGIDGVLRKPDSSAEVGRAGVGALDGGGASGGCGGGTSGRPPGIDGLNVGSSTSM